MELLCVEQDHIQRAYKDPVFLKDKVVQNLLKLEECYMIPARHMEQQKDVRPYMRKVVAQWMLEVCEEQRCEEEVFALSVNFLDRVLAVTESVERRHLQLLATACMFIASKLKETLTLSAEKLVIYTDYSITTSQLLDWEILVLSKLKFDVSPVIALDFLDVLLDKLRLPDDMQKRLRTLALSYSMIFPLDEKSVVYLPSMVASACICAGIEKMTNSWRASLYARILAEFTKADLDCLMACTEYIQRRLKNDEQEVQCNFEKQSPVSYSGTPTEILDIRVN